MKILCLPLSGIAARPLALCASMLLTFTIGFSQNLTLKSFTYPGTEILPNVEYRAIAEVESDASFSDGAKFLPLYSADGIKYTELDTVYPGMKFVGDPFNIGFNKMQLSDGSSKTAEAHFAVIYQGDTVLKFKRSFNVVDKLERDLDIELLEPKEGDIVQAGRAFSPKIRITNKGRKTLHGGPSMIYRLVIAGFYQNTVVNLPATITIGNGESADLSLPSIEIKESSPKGKVPFCIALTWAERSGNLFSPIDDYLDNDQDCSEIDVKLFVGDQDLIRQASTGSCYYQGGYLRAKVPGITGERISATVLSLNGQVLKQISLSRLDKTGTFQIDIGSMASGVYVLRLNSPSDSRALKFMVN